jgi:hypothetical protein
MSLKDVQPGTYLATPVRGWFGKVGEKLTPACCVEFQFQPTSSGPLEKITATLYLTDNAQERSLETLLETLGINEEYAMANKDPKGIFPAEGSFTTNQVSLVLENETYKDKTFLRVKWINRVGGSQFGNTKPELSLGNQEIRGLFVKGRYQLGHRPAALPTSGTAQKTSQPNFNSEDVPF